MFKDPKTGGLHRLGFFLSQPEISLSGPGPDTQQMAPDAQKMTPETPSNGPEALKKQKWARNRPKIIPELQKVT